MRSDILRRLGLVGSARLLWQRGRPTAFASGSVVAAATLAYLNALRADFQFDDYTVIVNNPAAHSLGAWAASMPGIRPLLKLSYALTWSAGLGAPGFHALNLLCHVAAALLAMRLLRRLALASASLSPLADSTALTAGLIFALHPAQSEAVTYASGRSVSLMAALYLAAIAAHHPPPRSLGARVFSPLLFALALATKETAVTLPLALVLIERVTGSPWREAVRRTLPHWTILGVAALAGLAIPGSRRLFLFALSIRSVGENLLTQVDGIGYLLIQPLFLLRTNIDPPLVPQAALTPRLAVQGCLLLGALVVGVLLFRRRLPCGAATLWFFLHLAPTNSFLPRLDVANDRQLYLAILGPAFLVAEGLWRWFPRGGARITTAALALVLAATTVSRNAEYRTEVTLWTATVAASPRNARAWNNLGYAYQQAGEVASARRAYRHALHLDPRAFRARWNLEALAGAGWRSTQCPPWDGSRNPE